ncbi:MAG TPA: hypothetical protein VF093_01225 [Solirubrobacterales bacterium]
MSKIGSKRPSPALVISILALFVALGGSAYAAKKIGSNEIKANAITTGKIKKNAVTTAKIKKNAVTGAKINEGTLGVVPNATHATTAGTATSFSRYFTTGLKKAGLGQQVQLASSGPFTFTGVCNDLGGGEYEALIKATTSQSGSFFTSDETFFSEADFDPGDEGIASDTLTSTSPYWYGTYGYYDEWTAANPDGSLLLRGHGDVGVKVFGADCAFLLTWESDA